MSIPVKRSTVRDALRDHVLAQLPGTFDAVVYFDRETAQVEISGLLKKTGGYHLLVTLSSGEADNTSGRRQTLRLRALFDCVVIRKTPSEGRSIDAWNTFVNELDDVTDELHDALQPASWDVTTDLGTSATVEVGEVVPVPDLDFNYEAKQVRCTVTVYAT